MKPSATRTLTFLSVVGLGLAAGPSRPACAAPAAPDLMIDLASPATAAPGEDIGPRTHLVVKNVGQAPAHGTLNHPAGYMVDLTLGRDPVVPAGFRTYSPHFAEDVLLKGGRVSRTVDLGPRAFQAYPVGAGIPADTPPGDYFLCATVDPGGAVAESNEANNTTCRRLTIPKKLKVGPQEDLPNRFK
jgi:hypothetical protein